MKSQIKLEPPLETRFAGQPETPSSEGSPRLQVNVIFTTEQATLTALEAAGHLAHGLNARINLIDAQVVPLAFSIGLPPVSLAFSLRRLHELARQGAQDELETSVKLYLCRDKQQTLLKALSPRSLVVIGGKNIWWPSKEKSIARMLERHGHRVVFAVQGRRSV